MFDTMSFPIDLEPLRRAAERGDADAQVALGAFLMDGDCIEQDPAEAVRW